MDIGVFTCIYNNLSLTDALSKLSEKKIHFAEIAIGGYSNDKHCNKKLLLSSETARDEFKSCLRNNSISISALSNHVNGVHPNSQVAEAETNSLKEAILLCEKLEINTLNTFSGCPGEPGGKYSNWIVQPWPDELYELYQWQWNDILIPYWKEMMLFAEDHGVKIALEMHPGFAVYNVYTLFKLINAVDSYYLGCNFDPSHLIWQNVDIPAAVHEVGSRIFHVHAKDVAVQYENMRINGNLDPKHYQIQQSERSWIFRSVGRGQNLPFWTDFVRALRLSGYDSILSIEHEDPFMSKDEGIDTAIKSLKEALANI